MNAANKILKSSTIQDQSVEMDNVIIDERLVKPVKKPEINKRQISILVLLLASIVIFFIGRHEKVSKLQITETIEPLKIGNILIDNTSFIEKKETVNNTVSNKEKAPEDVINFLYDDSSIVHREGLNEQKIVIYEIIDEKKNEQKIEELLLEASALLKADKLTSPEGNNAFDTYELVFSMDPSNKEALDGVKRIVKRYTSLADKVIKKKEAYKVAGLIKNAYKVGDKYFDMSPILKKYASYINDENVFIDVAESRILESSIEPKENDDVAVKRPVVEVDRATAIAALRLIENKDYDGAIKVLEVFASLSDYWGDSYRLLLSLYLQQLQTSKAEMLVNNNKSLDVFQMAENVARIFVAHEDIEGAIGLLNGHVPSMTGYKSYYALKAGLYYEGSRYEESTELYKNLLKIKYENPRYWLGLAVSLDALGEDTALQAFRYADQYALPNSDVKEYIEQRILLLSN